LHTVNLQACEGSQDIILWDWGFLTESPWILANLGCACRLKRFAVSAFMIIATVRGFLLNFGVYSATRAALGLSFRWSPAIL